MKTQMAVQEDLTALSNSLLDGAVRFTCSLLQSVASFLCVLSDSRNKDQKDALFSHSLFH